jgi:hypothetical protein
LFVRVGKNQFAPIYSVVEGEELYMWDDDLKQIVPLAPTCDEELRILGAGVYTPVSGFAGNRMDKSRHK